MSKNVNHRRGQKARTETGPTWENRNPGAGCNSTHVARGRKKWKRLRARSVRRTGQQLKAFRTCGFGRPEIHYDDDEQTLDVRVDDQS